MQPPSELEIARNRAARGVLSRRSRALYPLARHPSLRELPRRYLAASAAPAPALLQRLRVLPLGRRSGRRGRQPFAGARTAGLVGPGTVSLLCGPAVASRLHRSCANHSFFRYSRRAVPAPADRFSAGPNCAPLPILGKPAWLLPVFGGTRGAPGALSLRISRRRTPASFRRDLHRPATCEFLARRFSRPDQGPHLHSAGRFGAARVDRGRY